jgi:hypothetical protein
VNPQHRPHIYKWGPNLALRARLRGHHLQSSSVQLCVHGSSHPHKTAAVLLSCGLTVNRRVHTTELAEDCNNAGFASGSAGRLSLWLPSTDLQVRAARYKSTAARQQGCRWRWRPCNGRGSGIGKLPLARAALLAHSPRRGSGLAAAIRNGPLMHCQLDSSRVWAQICCGFLPLCRQAHRLWPRYQHGSARLRGLSTQR